MTENRRRASRKEIAQAIRELRAYHQQGCASLRALPQRGKYGQHVLDAQAEELGWNVTRLRKARQFADPEEGYSPDRLKALCRLLRQHRLVLGTSHIGVLVTLTWAEGRAELQQLCLEHHWSTAELQAEIKQRLGPRRQGGRWRQVGAEEGQLLIQLDGLAYSWERWYGVASGTLGKPDHRQNVLPQLPRAVRQQVEEIAAAMTALRAQLSKKLKEIRAKAARR